MDQNRRAFLQTVGAAGVGLTRLSIGASIETSELSLDGRHFRYVQIDVFTSHRLQGNPLAVFTDARGLTDDEMQGIARETNLSETTFVFPQPEAVEREHGIKVRIFLTDQEIPFAGHPTLGTAMVLRQIRQAEDLSEINLDLKVGKVPVRFTKQPSGLVFGEMRQIDPEFGAVQDRATIASVLDLQASDIPEDAPVQWVSTGLPFIIVPIRELRTLQRLTAAPKKAYEYVRKQNLPELTDFYFVTRDTGDAAIGLRSRGVFTGHEDPATGSAAGCTASWLVRHRLARLDQTVHILQGVEMQRPSHIFVRATKDGEKISNVRVGGNAVSIMEGTLAL
jgi:trans-2,3-dihydro-3-hydroxyanthranilate isomerase